MSQRSVNDERQPVPEVRKSKRVRILGNKATWQNLMKKYESAEGWKDTEQADNQEEDRTDLKTNIKTEVGV